MDVKAALNDDEKLILENIKLEHEEPTICYITAEGKTSETAIKTEEDSSCNNSIFESNTTIEGPILVSEIKVEEPTFATEIKTEDSQTPHHAAEDGRKDDKTFECFECKKTFKQLFVLKSHWHTHTNEKSFVCDHDECSKSFRTQLNLKRHQQKHAKGSYECSTFSKKLPEQSSVSRLKKHWKTHVDVTPYSCEICSKQYKLYESLQIHLQGHNERTCEICAKEFKTIFRLKVHHRNTHSGDKPFSCDFCDKCFLRKSTLLNHRLIHTDERPFQCPECTAKFRKLVNLNTHILRHSNDRPHSCTICDKKFKTKCDLQTHIKNHSEERPHACNTCPMRFKSKSDLKRHTRIHTGAKPYECNECSQKFAYNDSLYKHKKKDHSLKSEGIESSKKIKEIRTQCVPIARHGDDASFATYATSQPIEEADVYTITTIKTEIDSAGE